MAWIRVDQSLRQHRKLIALGDELGIDAATAAGHLVFLWLWCLDNAPTGIIKQPSSAQKPPTNVGLGVTDSASKCKSNTRVAVTDLARATKSNRKVISTNSAPEPKGTIRVNDTDRATKCIGNIRLIATACAWSGNPNDLVNALLSVGFLNRCGRGGISLRIHDWYEYAGKLCDARAAHKERMRRARAGATVRNSTKRNDTKENDLTPYSPPKRGTDDPPSFQHVSLSDQDPTACAVWDGILGELKSKVTKPNWETWLKNTVGFAIEEDRLVVVAPNEGAAEWL